MNREEAEKQGVTKLQEIQGYLKAGGYTGDEVPHEIQVKARHTPMHTVTWYAVWVIGTGKKQKRYPADKLTPERVQTIYEGYHKEAVAQEERGQTLLAKVNANVKLVDSLGDLGLDAHVTSAEDGVQVSFRVVAKNHEDALRIGQALARAVA